MIRWVLDASVLVKWVLPERHEADTARAEAFLAGFVDRSLTLVEPPHWLAEVAAVVSRLAPEKAAEATALLCSMEISVDASVEAYAAAVDLAVRRKHHLFDTLYHGVALITPDTFLVTADDAYFRRARSEGRIVRLADVADPTTRSPRSRIR